MECNTWISGDDTYGSHKELLGFSPIYALRDIVYNLYYGINPIDKVKGNPIIDVRDYVLRGYPNGYSLMGAHKFFYDFAAKQREDAQGYV